jgi:hypothetical protein
VAKDLAAFGKMTAQLNEDALIDLGDKWAMAAAVAFSYAEDNAAFNGDGTSTYGGITGLFTKIVARRTPRACTPRPATRRSAP